MSEGGEATRFLDLGAEGSQRRFLLAIPAARVLALRDRRLGELRLPPATDEAAASDPGLLALRARIAASALADACRLAGEEAVAALARRQGLRPIGAPQIETLAAPPGGELILRVAMATLPDLTPPDPATLRIEKLVVPPDPEEVARVLAALAESRADWRPLPHDGPAGAGDLLVCDIVAQLLPPPDRLPPAEWLPGRLPGGWIFGDNGAGLAFEVLDSAAGRLRFRLHGTPAALGQSYILFHPPTAIPARPGSTWSGSLGFRLAAPPVGLRSGKLRLDSRNASGQATLRRKDAGLAIAASAEPQRIFVSNTLADAGTGFVRLALLLDHQGGPLDVTAEIEAPRLVEGLDLGQAGAVALPEMSGEGRRIELGGTPDPAGLAPHLLGLEPGQTREVTLRLPAQLMDRALADRPAAFTVTAREVLRRTAPPVDAALAQALGFPDLAALRAFAAQRVAARDAELSRRQLRQALTAALLAASPPVPLPEAAVQAELAAIWPRLAAGGSPPPREAALALAERRLRATLLLDAVARIHALEPVEADFAAAAEPGPPPPAEALRRRALRARAVAFLLERATIVERTATLAELQAAAQEM